ncbi:enoyl-CoA hydratase/isomerase family protein [Phosphitispora fastidiosa]|uniref:enoyl-CoA hydratase/isomerase family protein n=1 Tax=Phosphitispora fastidiosa TaxID=2837202 RepID=UPI001E28A84A|nr:enoyl-CoA hydratase [Phosphitispora fastidiosa]
MKTKSVICDINDGIAVITINNPPVNALSKPVMTELNIFLDGILASSSIQVVIITGFGERAFVAGADINQFLTLDSLSGRDWVLDGQKIISKITTLSQPVIAAINGPSLGGGCELVLACDIRIASENAFIGLPEVNLGVIPGYGGTQRLPRLIGQGRAMAMILTGDPVKAEEALHIGLVEKLVPAGQALAEAMIVAKRIMTRGPLAVRAAKKAIDGGLETTLEKGLLLEAELFSAICGTEDQKEGAKAFLSKRPPVFKGR